MRKGSDAASSAHRQGDPLGGSGSTKGKGDGTSFGNGRHGRAGVSG